MRQILPAHNFKGFILGPARFGHNDEIPIFDQLTRKEDNKKLQNKVLNDDKNKKKLEKEL